MDPPSLGDLSVVGSASHLASLDLEGKSMETEYPLEVPDTPDRVPSRHERTVAGGHGSLPSSTRFRSKDGFGQWQRNNKPVSRVKSGVTLNSNSLTVEKEHGFSKNLTNSRSRPTVRSCVSNHDNVLSPENKINRHDIFDSTVQVIHLDSSPHASSAGSVANGFTSQLPFCTTEKGKTNTSGHGADLNRAVQSQNAALSLKLDGLPRITGHGTSTRSSYLPPYTIEKHLVNGIQDGDEVTFSNDGISHGKWKGKAIELSPDTIPDKKRINSCSSKVNAPRKMSLVRNGLISPANRAKTKDITEVKNDKNNSISIKSPEVDSLQQVCNFSSAAEGHCLGKEKGKNILYEGFNNGRETESRSSRSRLGNRRSARSNVSVADSNEDISYFVQELDQRAWTTTGNRKRSSNGGIQIADGVSLLPSHGDENIVAEVQHVNVADDILSSEFVIPQPHGLRSNLVKISRSSDDAANGRNQGHRRIMNGKRKGRSGQSFQEENSTAEAYNPLPTLPGQPSNNFLLGTSSVNDYDIMPPIIDIDELSTPESRRIYPRSATASVPGAPNERDLQVESDELLARQLQEQLFNESPGPGSFEEIDAGIARSLQQQEGANNTFSTRSHHSQSRDTSMAHLYRHYSRNSARNSNGQISRQRRSMPRISQLRRSMNRRHMDLDARLNYLEALEAAFDSSNETSLPSSLLHLERDFNENDYEMLLTLDSDNHRHSGASCHQINSLPVSAVQTDSLEEACAICLDAPSLGEAIRHLPCLHKFHKDCIDTWLRRKSECPVCKSGIT